MKSAITCRNNSTALFPREVEKLLDSVFGQWAAPNATVSPTQGVHIVNEDKNVIVHFDAPGFDADDFQITFGDNTLKVEAVHTPPEELKLPFGHRKFSRTLSLPVDFNSDGVEAIYRSGVLSVTLPKAEKLQWKKVEVKRS